MGYVLHENGTRRSLGRMGIRIGGENRNPAFYRLVRLRRRVSERFPPPGLRGNRDQHLGREHLLPRQKNGRRLLGSVPRSRGRFWIYRPENPRLKFRRGLDRQ